MSAKAKPSKGDSKESKESNPALSNTLGQIEKMFGTGSIMRLSDASHLPIAGIPSGALSLDLALGGFGFPRGEVADVAPPCAID